VIGNETMEAVNDFQRDNNLPVDNYLNIKTVEALGVKPREFNKRIKKYNPSCSASHINGWLFRFIMNLRMLILYFYLHYLVLDNFP